MQQLTGLDAAFLALDSSTAYGHVGSVSVLDPPKGGERPPPRIRFVIPKLHAKVRRERVKNYYVACGRSISSRQDPPEKDDGRFHLDFGLLHAGL